MTRWQRLPLLHLAVLFIEYILGAWLLSDFNAPWFTWVGTLAITSHLAWVGPDAIALAVAWIVGIVWAGAFSMAWPKSVPWVGYAAWAAALALSWILGLVLALTLAKTEKTMKLNGLRKPQAFCILVLITWMGLRIGRVIDSGF